VFTVLNKILCSTGDKQLLQLLSIFTEREYRCAVCVVFMPGWIAEYFTLHTQTFDRIFCTCIYLPDDNRVEVETCRRDTVTNEYLLLIVQSIVSNIVQSICCTEYGLCYILNIFVLSTRPLQPSGYCTYRQFNILSKFCVLPTQCVCVALRTNSDYFPIQH
jgi:hypothetical protein